MSKSLNLVLIIVTGWALALPALGQDLTVSIKIQGHTATVEGSFSDGFKRSDGQHLTFLNEYAGVNDLAKRFSKVASETQALKRFNASEYVSENGVIKAWKYEVDLSPPAGTVAPAHTSWVGSEVGILMLDDLLPQVGPATARVELILPDGWSVYTSESAARGAFDVSNTEKASFLIGRNVRRIDSGSVDLLTLGEWQFTDKEAGDAVRDIASFYTKLFGSPPSRKPQIAVLKFPTQIQPGEWEADTRGSTVTIVSSDATFASQSRNRLHEQLRHEIFHLWIPNGVNLSGNYDWFYEGFALYQSLKLGVATNRIRFADYLDTLSRAYAIDNFSSRRVSLIEASRNRFSGNGTRIYARGMLVAFLCDLAMLEASKGKRSTDDLVREIYQKYPLSSPRTDGNTAILSSMKQHPELGSIADSYITGTEALNWGMLLSEAGIEATQNGRETVLTTVAKPGGRQKGILDKLGYNNWRKSGSK